MTFHDAGPSPAPGVHIFSVRFDPDGAVAFAPDSDDAGALAQRMEWLMEIFASRPSLLLGAWRRRPGRPALVHRLARTAPAEPVARAS